MRVPVGSTRTYTEIAEAVAKPTSRRAVARACATNPVAVVVPCHRIVRSDGGLGGYAYGLDRKQKLLAIEKRAAKNKR
jgi:AraC family transcriptional regulator of adaptative response/methylated-DNA-[protein]-cysteine methyltransferase